jgi:hypothetical protein
MFLPLGGGVFLPQPMDERQKRALAAERRLHAVKNRCVGPEPGDSS